MTGELGGIGWFGVEFEGGFELAGELGASSEGVIAEAAEDAAAFGFNGLSDRQIEDALLFLGEFGTGDRFLVLNGVEVLLKPRMVEGIGFDAGTVGGGGL